MRPLPGGNVALVCAAVRDGRPVVLELTPRGHPDDVLLASEARTLAFWRSTGAAIELLERDDDGFTLLLERARPGTPLLQSVLSWDEMLVDLGRLARRLHTAGTPPALSCRRNRGDRSRRGEIVCERGSDLVPHDQRLGAAV